MYDMDQFAYCRWSLLNMLEMEEILPNDQTIEAAEMLVNAKMCRSDRRYLKFCTQLHLVLEVRSNCERNKKITEECLLSDTHYGEKEIKYLG
jgi:hypothetical protein